MGLSRTIFAPQGLKIIARSKVDSRERKISQTTGYGSFFHITSYRMLRRGILTRRDVLQHNHVLRNLDWSSQPGVCRSFQGDATLIAKMVVRNSGTTTKSNPIQRNQIN